MAEQTKTANGGARNANLEIQGDMLEIIRFAVVQGQGVITSDGLTWGRLQFLYVPHKGYRMELGERTCWVHPDLEGKAAEILGLCQAKIGGATERPAMLAQVG